MFISETFSWKGRSCKLTLKVPSLPPVEDDDDDDDDIDPFGVEADLFRSRKKIGHLSAHLLPRPCRDFFRCADEASEEMVHVATLFCEPNGAASRLTGHPKMTHDAIHDGGFLNIYTVEIDPQYQKQDLGLLFVHHVLTQLKGHWTLATMVPCSLGQNLCEWEDNAYKRPKMIRDLSKEQELIDQCDLAVTRHFARMGFSQAGKKQGQMNKTWFLTAGAYFANPDPIDSWLTKTEAIHSIQIHRSITLVEPTGLDKELKETVSSFCDSGVDTATKASLLQQIGELVRRGASVNNSRSLQMAAANAENPTRIFETLLSLGGDINSTDEAGNTALHVAASFRQHATVEYLIRLVANPVACNSDGDTPIDCFKMADNANSDFLSTLGIIGHAREVACLCKLKGLYSFTPLEQRPLLLDGWLSPRMKFILETTCELAIHNICDECELEFTPFQPLPLPACCNLMWGVDRINYIPASVLQTKNSFGLSGSFKDGWGYCFVAAHAILQRGQAPTVSAVEMFLESNFYVFGVDYFKVKYFEQHGGRVEFAIDAIINISQNVAMDGNDGWELYDLKEELEALPATPLDEAFDIARIKCINQGGGTGEFRGPYHETTELGMFEFNQQGDV